MAMGALGLTRLLPGDRFPEACAHG
jgi:hypothetical protein